MGSYAESLLTSDERIIMRQRQHWVALILDSWLAMLFLGWAVAVFVLRLFLPEEVFGHDLFGSETWFSAVLVLLALTPFVVGIIVLAIRIWHWRTQEFLVTNHRLVMSWGIFNKHASDSSLEKIDDAVLEISFLGRILDYGRLDVLTASPLEGQDYLDRLNHAREFKKAMLTAKHDLQTGHRGDSKDASQTAPQSAATAESSGIESSQSGIDVSGGKDPHIADTPDEVAAVLDQLADLRDAGRIAEEDYEAKKHVFSTACDA